jgi:hypothetical protein
MSARWKSADLTPDAKPKRKGAAKPKGESANLITRRIITALRLARGHARRISTTGIPDGQGGFRTNMAQRGVADIHAIYKGRHLSIEVKAGKDEQSTWQRIEEQDVTLAGGTYLVVRSTDEFFAWFSAWRAGVDAEEKVLKELRKANTK